jgi:hypothetical protein
MECMGQFRKKEAQNEHFWVEIALIRRKAWVLLLHHSQGLSVRKLAGLLIIRPQSCLLKERWVIE